MHLDGAALWKRHRDHGFGGVETWKQIASSFDPPVAREAVRSAARYWAYHHDLAAPVGLAHKAESAQTAAGYVYCVGILEVPGQYKIGVSRRPEKRLVELATLMPVTLFQVHVVYSANARRVERLLHRAFADKRTVGEWFKLDAVDLAFIYAIRDVQ